MGRSSAGKELIIQVNTNWRIVINLQSNPRPLRKVAYKKSQFLADDKEKSSSTPLVSLRKKASLLPPPPPQKKKRNHDDLNNACFGNHGFVELKIARKQNGRISLLMLVTLAGDEEELEASRSASNV